MTFYALLKTSKVGGGVDGDGMPVERWSTEMHSITEAEAVTLRGALRVHVTGFGYEPQGPDGPNNIVLSGPKPPVEPGADEYYDFNDPEASGVLFSVGTSNLGYPWMWPNESIEIAFQFLESGWPAEYPRGAFVVEYEAEAEMLYADESYYGDPYLYMWANEWETRVAMQSRTEGGLGVHSFKIYTLNVGGPKEPDRLLLRMTIDPSSDGTVLQSYFADPVLAPWVAGWPNLAAYPGQLSPLLPLLEPFAHASFTLPITLDMITLPAEGPPLGATLSDFLYMEVDMLPDFPELDPSYYGINDLEAYFYASLPTWQFSDNPRIERATVREVRLYSVGGGTEPEPPVAFWTGLIGTTEKL